MAITQRLAVEKRKYANASSCNTHEVVLCHLKIDYKAIGDPNSSIQFKELNLKGKKKLITKKTAGLEGFTSDFYQTSKE